MSRLACASTSTPRSTGETGTCSTSRGMSPVPSLASALRTALRPAVVETVPAGALCSAHRAPPWTRQRDAPCNASLPQRSPVERDVAEHCTRPLPGEKSPHPERRSTTGVISARVEPPLRRGAAQAGRFLSLPMVTLVAFPCVRPRRANQYSFAVLSFHSSASISACLRPVSRVLLLLGKTTKAPMALLFTRK
jgi:hypothetical protein